VTTTKLDYKKYIEDIRDIINNVEGAGQVSEIDEVLTSFFANVGKTPVPDYAAYFLDNIIDVLNNVEGAGLDSELKHLLDVLPETLY